MQIELETVEITTSSRTTGNGEYDQTVAALMAKGWEMGKGMKKGVTPAQHAGLRGAIARHNERVGADSPDRLNVSFHVVSKGADGKPTEYSFRRNANDAPRRGRKPVAVAVVAPTIETL